MTTFQNLSVERTGNVLRVTPNNPATRNALSRRMATEWRGAAQDCGQELRSENA